MALVLSPPRRSSRPTTRPDRLAPLADSSFLCADNESEHALTENTLTEYALDTEAASVARFDEVDKDSNSQSPTPKRPKKSETATRRVSRNQASMKTKAGSAYASRPHKQHVVTTRAQQVTKSGGRKRQKPVTLLTKAVAVKPLSWKINGKPKAIGEPEAWADSRQGLCETLPYYRSFQGGAYCLDGVCYGFLLAYDGTSRLHFDSQIVITRASGGQAIDPKTGKMVQTRDHGVDSANVQAMYNSREMHMPIVLIAGDDNINIPTKMPHPYNVLGYFQVTDIWAELNNGCVCYKFRFEKIDLTTQSWWAATPELVQPDYSIKSKEGKCMYCTQLSPQILEKWFCLNRDCFRFWKHSSNGFLPGTLLGYDPDFLNKRTPWPKGLEAPFNLRPDFFPSDKDASKLAYTLSGWRGMCCPECHCCSARVFWNKLECPNERCGFVHHLNQPTICAKAAARNPFTQYDGHAVSQDTWDEKFITAHQETLIGKYRLSEYHLPLPGNVIYHFQANKPIQKAPNGPDELFVELQRQDFGLKRHINGSRTDKGAQLSRHFAVNFGMPYKYILAVDSKPFAEAPAPIVSALQRCRWAGRQVGQTEEGEFNEVLAVGYFETGKMGYHDDGEKELGPTVATLGLGGPATMTMRMKEKHWSGYTSTPTKGKIFDPAAEILPNSYLERERRELKAEVEAGLAPEEVQKKFAKLLQTTKERKTANCPAFLRMRFLHGDIIIMQGAEVQKYFEHEIKFDGDLRFALTCRHVKWDLYPLEEHEKAKFDAEKFPPYDGAKDGEEKPKSAVVAAEEVMDVDG